MNGEFFLNDGVLSDAEVELLKHFIRHVSRRYRLKHDDVEFKFRAIQIGMSSTTKLVAHSREIYPYFIKIGDNALVNKEVSNYNRASARVPPLYLPPLEQVIDGDVPKYHSDVTAGNALVAYRYISGRNKGKPPISLFSAFPEIGKYRMIELIDEVFGVVLKDLHAFSNHSNQKKFQHFSHDGTIFDAIENKRLSEMVAQYNELVETAPRPELPHGMVHGDLHCENIIVNKKLSPIVIDFEMMRREGCLLNDFAEFEVAIIVAALDSDTDRYASIVREAYSRSSMFEVFGTDKLSRCIRSIRSNLADMLFREANLKHCQESLQDIQQVYNCLLLRYLCSYAYVAKKSLSEQRGLLVFAVLEDLFDRKLSATETEAKKIRKRK